MMMRTGQGRFGMGALVLLCAASSPALGQSRRSAPALIPANFSAKQDALGFPWQVYSSYGNLRNSSSSTAFYHAGMLTINGTKFSPSHRVMTADGSEYHLSNPNINRVAVARQIKLDLKHGTARILDTLQNTGQAPLSINVQINSRTRHRAARIVTDAGRTVAVGNRSNTVAELEKKEIGLAVQSSQAGTPGFLIYVAGGNAKMKPAIKIDGNYQFTMTYVLALPPGERVTLVHGYAQRRVNMADAKVVKKEFEPFRARDFLGGLDRDLQKTIINRASRSLAALARQPLLHEMLELTDFWSVERGKQDILVVDGETTVGGTLRGERLTLQTEQGPAEIPIGQIAALAGAGQGTRVYLRNGEILFGRLDGAASLVLVTPELLELKITPAKVKMLVTRADPADSRATDNVAALVQTSDGTRLAVPTSAELTLPVATPWGPMDVPVGEIRRLFAVREPQPVFVLTFKDNSRLEVMLRGESWSIPTVRFGKLELAAAEILEVFNAALPAVPAEDDATVDNIPFVELRGENRLVGRIAADKLTVMTTGGESLIPTVDVQSIDVNGGSGGPQLFQITLHSGAKISGRLKGHTLPFAAMGHVWDLRLNQIHALLQPKPTDRAEQKAPEEADTSPVEPADDDLFGRSSSGGELDQLFRSDPFGP